MKTLRGFRLGSSVCIPASFYYGASEGARQTDVPLRVHVRAEEPVERGLVVVRELARDLLHLGGRQRLKGLRQRHVLIDVFELRHAGHGQRHAGQRERIVEQLFNGRLSERP